MPSINRRLADVGRGFAAFLTPPPEGVVRFSVGQPDFKTPDVIVSAAKNALDRGLHGYTRSQGSEELCTAVCDHLSQHGVIVDAEDIVITPGCKQALLYAMMTCLEPGDEVILLAPAWPSYDGMLRLVGAVPIHVPVKRENYHPDLNAVKNAITSKTKALLINSPNNPTGAVYHPDEVKALTEICVENDLWIFDDMVYATMVWSDHPYVAPASLPGGAERTLTIGGWSKGWAMTGWRLGWIGGPPGVMEGVKTCQASAASHIPTFLMPAAECAIRLKEEPMMMSDSFRERMKIFHALLTDLPGIEAPSPEGAFYILADISGTGMSDIEFAQQALSQANVQVIPASLMEGGEGLIRFSGGTSIEQIQEGVQRLRQWLESL
jgi:aspartate/methionine/tyrosine aminotransferase